MSTTITSSIAFRVTAAVVSAIVLGIAAWMLFAPSADEQAVNRLLDQTLQAVEDRDATAIQGLIRSDFRFEQGRSVLMAEDITDRALDRVLTRADTIGVEEVRIQVNAERARVTGVALIEIDGPYAITSRLGFEAVAVRTSDPNGWQWYTGRAVAAYNR